MERVCLPVLEYGDVHVHTGYTDGKNTIREYCQKALQNNLEAIAFTEHVRKNLDYSFDNFLLDVEKVRREFLQLVVSSGCEVKVLDTKGGLDAPETVLKQCEIVIGVFHSFKHQDKRSYLTALKAMLRNPVVDIWGHPTLFLREHNMRLEKEELNGIINLCIENGVLIERNLKYSVPDADFIRLAVSKGAKFVIGSDAHNINELPTMHRLKEEWNWLNKMS